MAQLSIRGVMFGACCGIASSLFLAGCSGSGQGFSSSTKATNTLLGTWTRSSIAADGSSISCPNSLTVNSIVVDSCVAGETIAFNADGTYLLTNPATKFGAVYTESGTYNLSGTSLTMTRLSNDVVAGVITPGTTVSLASAIVVPNTLTFSGTSVFTLQPAVPASGAGYVIPLAADGTTVVSTYTKN